MIAELTVLAQFIVFLALPTQKPAAGGPASPMKDLAGCRGISEQGAQKTTIWRVFAGTTHAVAI